MTVDPNAEHDNHAPDELVGERILVRRLEPADADALWQAIDSSREHLAAWMVWTASYRSVQDALDWIDHASAAWDANGDRQAGIFLAGREARLLGGIGLHLLPRGLRSYEIGYWLRQDAQGRGYAREAVQLVTRLAFGPLAANRVAIRVEPGNLRSRRVAESLGFVVEGTARRAAVGGQGQAVDVIVHSLIPEEFERLPWAAGQDLASNA